MVNKVILVGNLGRDAELRYTSGGTATTTVNLACTKKWKDKSGELQERTEWVRVVLWGRTAEALSEYLLKGKQIYVEGELQTRKWQGRDGKDNYTTEVRADRIQLLGGKGGNSNRRQAPTAQSLVAEDSDPFDTPGGFEEGGNVLPDAGDGFGGGELLDDDIPF